MPGNNATGAQSGIFILSQFPCYDETFILRELGALKAQGLAFRIFSLKTPRDRIVQEDARAFLNDTIYGILTEVKFFEYYFRSLDTQICRGCVFIGYSQLFYAGRIYDAHDFTFWPK